MAAGDLNNVFRITFRRDVPAEWQSKYSELQSNVNGTMCFVSKQAENKTQQQVDSGNLPRGTDASALVKTTSYRAKVINFQFEKMPWIHSETHEEDRTISAQSKDLHQQIYKEFTTALSVPVQMPDAVEDTLQQIKKSIEAASSVGDRQMFLVQLIMYHWDDMIREARAMIRTIFVTINDDIRNALKSKGDFDNRMYEEQIKGYVEKFLAGDTKNSVGVDLVA